MSVLKKFRSVVLLVMVLIGGHAAVSSAAMYDGAWLPNDTDFYAYIKFLTPNSDANLYLYDLYGVPNESLKLFPDPVTDDANIWFTLDSGSWYASLSKGGLDLNLGTSKAIWFYFQDGATKYTSYDVTTRTPGDNYELFDPNTSMTVRVHDIAPVPLPASLFLLGSGIISLVVSRRKSR